MSAALRRVLAAVGWKMTGVIAGPWWACSGALAFFGIGELVVVAVVRPVTGHVPGAAVFSGLICLPLSLVALRKTRQARREGV